MTTALLLIAAYAATIGLPHVDAGTVPAAAPDAAPTLPPGVLVRNTAAGPVTVRVTGRASWHATGRSGLYAAACAPLRKALGKGWRGQQVLVASGRKAVAVVLNDWCRSRTKLIDLSDEAFRWFAPLSRGVIRVTVEGFR